MKHLRSIITIALIATLGWGIAQANWADPTIEPLGDGREIPVHSGSDQIKEGALAVQDVFFVAQNAQFDQTVFAQGIIRGGGPQASGPVLFGDQVYRVGIEANGTMYTRGIISSPSLINQGDQRQVCADQYGYLSLCQ